MTSPTMTILADEIIERLAKSYDLVYVNYDDRLMDTQVNALVRGDEWIDESWEFESDSKYESVKEIIHELVNEVARDWEVDENDLWRELDNDIEEYDRVRFEIEERDNGNWVSQLVRQTPDPLLRIEVIDEDHAYSFEEVKPRRVLKDVGLPATRANVETVNYVLANASPEYSVLMGFWIVGADLSDIENLGYDAQETELEIVNPYLYLGNPFSGSGFISERPLEGVVRVKRGDLRTDEDQWGYSVGNIYGGLNASQFECEIRKVESEEQ